MSTFSAADLEWMRETQDAHMQDTCRLLTLPDDLDEDAWGNPDVTYPESDEISCGFKHVNPRELMGASDVPLIDARLRLPIETEISSSHRVKITRRFDEALTPAQIYEVVGPVRRGPSALVADLRLVSDE